MLKEFRDFIAKGNVLDLAVAVVIGAAFGKIVDSLVKDIVMPPIGLILGRVDISNLFVPLNGERYATLAEAQAAAAPTLNYGIFLNQIISFVIVAFAVFVLIKQFYRFRRAEVAAANEKNCAYCQLAIPLAAVRCPHCTSQLQPS